MHDDLRYLLALTQINMVGHQLIRNLIGYCGSAQNVLSQNKSKLLKIPGIGEITAESISAFDDFSKVDKEIEFIKKHNVKVLPFYDPAYPQRLKELNDAPAILFQLGELNLNHPRMIAVVGTRKNTMYGKTFTEQLIHELAAYNIIIVSGLAYGIDAIAHKQAVHEKLPTIGVLAHGLDKVYPAVHTQLAKSMIKEGGALITENFTETIPDRENFPKRNRIVAGMVDAVVVVETDLKGGSMITAKLAIGYDRDVLALPGRVDDGYSRGCNYLIKNHQATMVESADDLLKLLNWHDSAKPLNQQIKMPLDLNKEQQSIYELIKNKGVTELDYLITESGLNSSRLAFVLLELEFKNAVISLPGKVYQVARA